MVQFSLRSKPRRLFSAYRLLLPVRKYTHSTIYCAVENRPQEIVFSQLTPPIGKAKVTSTCAAVPFGEVRSHSRVPVCRPRAAKKSGRTSQPLAMLCATRSDLRAARGPLQPIGRRLFRSAGVNDRQSRFSRIESVDRRGGGIGLNRVWFVFSLQFEAVNWK